MAKKKTKATSNATQAVESKPAKLFFLAQLAHGPNARKQPSEKTILELMESIRANGIKQNLQGTLEDGRVYIHAGGQRLTALLRLAEEGAIDPSTYQVPVVTDELDATGKVVASIAENTVRAQLEPLDEAEAYLKAMEGGAPIEELAVRANKSIASIQKRIALAQLLGDAVKDALRKKELTLYQAQLMTQVPLKEQKAVLKRFGAAHITRDRLARYLDESAFPVSRAVFTQEAAEEAGLVIATDLFDQLGDYYIDGKKARALQLQKAEAMREKLGNKWSQAFLGIGQEYSLRQQYNLAYERTKDKKIGVALIVVDPDTYAVEVQEGLKVYEREQSSKQSTSTERPLGWLTDASARLVHVAKVGRLQEAVAEFDDERRVLMLTIMALMGASPFGLTVLKELDELPANLTEAFDYPKLRALGTTSQPGQRLTSAYGFKLPKSIEYLETLGLNDLRAFQRLVLAQAIGTGEAHGYHNKNLRHDQLEIYEVAKLYELTQAEPYRPIDKEWLKGLTTQRLKEISQELGASGASSKKELIEEILAKVQDQPDYTPQEFFYSLSEANEERRRKMLEGIEEEDADELEGEEPEDGSDDE